jgi:hypothetical protein
MLRNMGFKAGLARMTTLDHGSRKICSCVIGHNDVTWCTHRLLAVVRKTLDTYFHIKIFATANS